MGKLTEQTIIKTVKEMIQEECDPGWIREEVECMFNQQFSDKEWKAIMVQVFLKRVFDQSSLENV